MLRPTIYCLLLLITLSLSGVVPKGGSDIMVGTTKVVTLRRQIRTPSESLFVSMDSVVVPQPAIIPTLTPTVQPVSAVVSYSGSLSRWLLALRTCESSNNYQENTGNGFYGAYQFTISTWDSLNTGYARADLAPPAVQDAAIIKNTLQSSGGLSTQNPGCYASQGLSNYPPN